MARKVPLENPGAERAALQAAIDELDVTASKLDGEAAAQVDGMAQVLSGALSASIYRPTPAEAMDLEVGTYFVTTDPETGKKALFERTAEAPGYAYFGPWIEKADVGLEEYPTSPEALPISTAQQEALDDLGTSVSATARKTDITITPEMFGAVGDGVFNGVTGEYDGTDDNAAVNRRAKRTPLAG